MPRFNSLPKVTPFEHSYIAKANSIAFGFLLLHLFGFIGFALYNGISVWIPVLALLLLLIPPALVMLRDRGSELGPVALGFSAMGVCGISIYVCKGAIEAHFEIFAMIAMLVVFGRMKPLLVGAATIALYYLVFWYWLPTAVFSMAVPFSMVLIHCFYVALEVVPTCWIARQFGRSIKAQGIVVESLDGAAAEIASAAQQVASSSQSLAQGVSEQAAAIEETMAATEEINSMAERNTENATATASVVNETSQRFYGSNVLLDEMVAAMEAIDTSSEQIARIIQVIDQIAFQTNILALNAAVEAARAGESGRGFAVVADEVRTLAQRSAQAAQDTSSLIADSIASSHAGKNKVEQVATAIRALTADSARMKMLVDEIHSGSREQSMGLQQISRSIQQMERVTQANAAGAEQSAAAAGQLTAQSKTVKEIVEQLIALG
jgi:hypothetical protein